MDPSDSFHLFSEGLLERVATLFLLPPGGVFCTKHLRFNTLELRKALWGENVLSEPLVT